MLHKETHLVIVPWSLEYRSPDSSFESQHRGSDRRPEHYAKHDLAIVT